MTQPRYLLDTNVLIVAARGPGSLVRDRIKRRRLGELALSAVSLAELEQGWQGGKGDRTAIEIILAAIPVLAFDARAAASYGFVMASNRHRTKTSFDRLIAGHALSLDLTVVTADQRGFAGVPGLRVEDWTEPHQPA